MPGGRQHPSPNGGHGDRLATGASGKDDAEIVPVKTHHSQHLQQMGVL
jgi:hypothetical protein